MIALFIFSSIAVWAQKMPPPPLIYSAPKPAEIKEFISPDRKFKVSFPGIPRVEKEANEVYSGSVYFVIRAGSNSIVNEIVYKENMEQKMDQFLERYKESILNSPNVSYGKTYPKAKIIVEKDIQIGDLKGKEFAYELVMQYYKVRVLFMKERVYEIKTDVTNWHILKDSMKDKVAEFDKESERFFNSFQILDSNKTKLD